MPTSSTSSFLRRPKSVSLPTFRRKTRVWISSIQYFVIRMNIRGVSEIATRLGSRFVKSTRGGSILSNLTKVRVSADSHGQGDHGLGTGLVVRRLSVVQSSIIGYLILAGPL
jgi:hypothetical protein